jgi:hypothetical protein
MGDFAHETHQRWATPTTESTAKQPCPRATRSGWAAPPLPSRRGANRRRVHRFLANSRLPSPLTMLLRLPYARPAPSTARWRPPGLERARPRPRTAQHLRRGHGAASSADGGGAPVRSPSFASKPFGLSQFIVLTLLCFRVLAAAPLRPFGGSPRPRPRPQHLAVRFPPSFAFSSFTASSWIRWWSGYSDDVEDGTVMREGTGEVCPVSEKDVQHFQIAVD